MKLNKIFKWKNEDLIPYFEKVPPEVFQEFAIRGGLEEGCDIDVLFPYIEKTQSLIEVGACYGRVLHHLLRKNYRGRIDAIERSTHFFGVLKRKYNKNINLIHADINIFQPKKKLDAILWLWSDISSFPKEEQLPILTHLCSWLKKDGIFILETLLPT